MKRQISLTQLQTHLDEGCKEKGWDNNSIAEVFLLFSEEIGELAKEIRIHSGLKQETKLIDSKGIRHEFADVLNYLMELANRFDINLTEVYFEKHKINKDRKW